MLVGGGWVGSSYNLPAAASRARARTHKGIAIPYVRGRLFLIGSFCNGTAFWCFLAEMLCTNQIAWNGVRKSDQPSQRMHSARGSKLGCRGEVHDEVRSLTDSGSGLLVLGCPSGPNH
eukprot:365297-Chlamydomonas_euryale.AAC.2